MIVNCVCICVLYLFWQVYKTLSATQKGTFLKQFEKKGTKDLSWVAAYSESVENSKKQDLVTCEDFLNSHQILKIHGLDPNTMSEGDVQKCTIALIIESEEQFQYKSETKTHPEIPLLTRHFFVWSKGLTVTETQETKDSVRIYKELRKDQIGLLQSASSSSFEGAVPIKMESAVFNTIKAKAPTLRSGKTLLERLLNNGQDLLMAMEIRAKADQAIRTKATEFKEVLEKLGLFVAELRTLLAELDALDGSEDDHQAILTKLEGMIEQALVHQEGMKEKTKKIKGFM